MPASKMPDGRWKVTCRYKLWDGTVKQHKKEGFPTKREAQQYEKDFLAKKSGSAAMKMSDFTALYLADLERNGAKRQTIKSAASTIKNRINPIFGEIPVDEITPLMIRNWYNDLSTKPSERTGTLVSPNTAETYYTRLHSIFSFARQFYGLKLNPCENAVKKRKQSNKEMSFLTVDEYMRFRTVEKNPIYKLAFDVLFWTGMREGEMLALTAEDIVGDTIRINKTLQREGGVDTFAAPKTEKSIRTITAPHHIIEKLSAIPVKQGRLFESVSPVTLRRHCRRNCERAGLHKIRVHDLRHSHASMLIEQNVSPLLVSERLGHKDVTVTLRTYSHLYNSRREDLPKIIADCYDFATHETD